MRPTFDYHPPRSMTEVWMCMWIKMIPKRGQSEYPTRISTNALGLLASEVDHMFIMVQCPYKRMDWR